MSGRISESVKGGKTERNKIRIVRGYIEADKYNLTRTDNFKRYNSNKYCIRIKPYIVQFNLHKKTP